MTRKQVPPIEEGSRAAGAVRRSIASELGLPANVIVAAGGGDTATSALGVGAAESGDGFLSLGTSGVLSVVTGQFRPSPHLRRTRALPRDSQPVAPDERRAVCGQLRSLAVQPHFCRRSMFAR
jgi:hypothetical protein